jgi:hypothetical protein
VICIPGPRGMENGTHCDMGEVARASRATKASKRGSIHGYVAAHLTDAVSDGTAAGALVSEE